MSEAMLSRSHAKKSRDDAGRTSERTALIAFAAAAAMLLLFYRGWFRTLLSCSADVCSTVIVPWFAGWHPRATAATTSSSILHLSHERLLLPALRAARRSHRDHSSCSPATHTGAHRLPLN